MAALARVFRAPPANCRRVRYRYSRRASHPEIAALSYVPYGFDPRVDCLVRPQTGCGSDDDMDRDVLTAIQFEIHGGLRSHAQLAVHFGVTVD